MGWSSSVDGTGEVYRLTVSLGTMTAAVTQIGTFDPWSKGVGSGAGICLQLSSLASSPSLNHQEFMGQGAED